MLLPAMLAFLLGTSWHPGYSIYYPASCECTWGSNSIWPNYLGSTTCVGDVDGTLGFGLVQATPLQLFGAEPAS